MAIERPGQAKLQKRAPATKVQARKVQTRSKAAKGPRLRAEENTAMATETPEAKPIEPNVRKVAPAVANRAGGTSRRPSEE